MTQTSFFDFSSNPFFDPKNNPFLDPTKNPFLNKDLADVFTNMKTPGFDVQEMVAAQRKNMEALNKASQAAFEGAQAVAQKQAEVFKAAFDQATSAADTLGKASTPQDLAAKELDLCKSAFETSLANTKKVTDMMTKANDAAVKVINSRITEALDEVKGQFAKPAK